MNKKTTKYERQQFIWGWLFLLPTVAGLIILNIIPTVQTVYQSFFKTGNFGKGNKFVGFANYIKMFHDAAVWQALWNTFKYALVEVPFSIIIALVLAVLMNKKIKFRSGYRTIYFLPMVAAPAAVAQVWKWLYNTKYGLLNHIATSLGHDTVGWITNPKYAFISVAFVGIWSVIGYNMVLFLAGLQEIPHDFYEASMLDGANGFEQFRYITLPLISPTMFFVSVTRIIAALQVFDSIYMMIERKNQALPKTQSLVCLFYRYAFEEANKGYGSTIIVLLLVVIMIITVIQLRLQKKWVNYN